MSDYDDIISENLENIASELLKLNQNIKVQNKILILQMTDCIKMIIIQSWQFEKRQKK
jgi:hypothetical protein